MDVLKFNKDELGLDKEVSYNLYDIWGKQIIEDNKTIYLVIPADDVIFIHYSSK
jgi:hypothetical protein